MTKFLVTAVALFVALNNASALNAQVCGSEAEASVAYRAINKIYLGWTIVHSKDFWAGDKPKGARLARFQKENNQCVQKTGVNLYGF